MPIHGWVPLEHVKIGLAYLVRSWWIELESIERPSDLLKLLYKLHAWPTEESNVI
jgi:hypothetical protein